ncbi:hypothetical protein NL676_017528 [Syzygium grande]|nr:hypothetical protein NL676_017528 [Syzygium grande]
MLKLTLTTCESDSPPLPLLCAHKIPSLSSFPSSSSPDLLSWDDRSALGRAFLLPLYARRICRDLCGVVPEIRAFPFRCRSRGCRGKAWRCGWGGSVTGFCSSMGLSSLFSPFLFLLVCVRFKLRPATEQKVWDFFWGSRVEDAVGWIARPTSHLGMTCGAERVIGTWEIGRVGTSLVRPIHNRGDGWCFKCLVRLLLVAAAAAGEVF